jgi:hypothetical protein
MDYLSWNKAIWHYFFKDNLRNSNEKVVLAVTKNVIDLIGKANNVADSFGDFLNAIKEGPYELDSNGINKFSIEAELDFLSKAHFYILNENYKTCNIEQKISWKEVSRWSNQANECIITAYIAYLVVMISGKDKSTNNEYWPRINEKLDIKTNPESQNYTIKLFEHLKLWAQKRGFNFYFKNIYTRKKNIGTIYSQLPFTDEEEMEIIASLYSAKSEDSVYFERLSNQADIEILEEFIDGQKSYLNAPTAKELNDDSSQLREVLLNYLHQNIDKYISEAKSPSDEKRIENILECRVTDANKFKPIYYLGIRNNQLMGFIFFNLISVSNLRMGVLSFKNHKYQYTSSGNFNINDDEGQPYLVYFIEKPFQPGTYSIFNAEIDTGLKIEVKEEQSLDNLNKLIWYRDFSKIQRHKIKIVETSPILTYEINNPYKIISINQVNIFTKEEIDKFQITSIIKNFDLKIGDSNHNVEIYSLELLNIENTFTLGGKTIKVSDSEFEITIKGAADGKYGVTSFLPEIPIQIIFNQSMAKRFLLLNHQDGNKNQIVTIEDFDIQNNAFDTNFIFKRKLDQGKYTIKIFDHSGNLIKQREFKINSEDVRDNRSEYYLKYRVSEFKKFDTGPTETDYETECVYTFSYELMEKIIDLLVKGKRIGNVYSTDFNYILNSIIEENCSDFFKQNQLKYFDLIELGKVIFYLLDNMNIIDRDVYYIKQLVKPYWIQSSINRRYNLIGALRESDIEKIKKVTSIKCQSQLIYRYLNGLKIGIHLPRQFFVEKCDEKNIPNVHEWIFCKINNDYDLTIKEPELEYFDIASATLKVKSDDSYYIALDNVNYFNWFTLKYEKSTIKEFKEILSYTGYHLFKIKTEKKYNNRLIEHYYLFESCGNIIKYQYFSFGDRHQAMSIYLKKLNHFDLTSILIKTEKNNIDDLCEHLAESGRTSIEHQNMLKEKDIIVIKSIINKQNVFKIDFNKTINGFFLYDEKNKKFAINSALKIPKLVEKYLFSLSGRLPGSIKIRTSRPNNVLEGLLKNTYYADVEVLYSVYPNIPEEIAFKLSNSLIKQLVAPIPGSVAKPYNTPQNSDRRVS